MTNERAKKILEFLAKKVGYSNIDIVKRCNKLYAFLVDELGNESHLFKMKLSNDGYDDYFSIDSLITAHCKEAYAELLDELFKASNEGCRIETKGDSIFLEPFMALEQIEIEMDLEA